MPLHLYLMIDTSGSMTGIRIELVNSLLNKLNGLKTDLPQDFHAEVHLNTFDNSVHHLGTHPFGSLPAVQANGGTDMIASLATAFKAYHDLLVPHNSVFFFYVTDNTEAFTIPQKIFEISHECAVQAGKFNEFIFGFPYCLNIEGTETTKISPLFGENNYVRIEHDNIDDKLHEIFAIILDIISKSHTTKVVLEKTTAIVSMETKLDEGKKIVEKEVKVMEKQSTKLDTILAQMSDLNEETSHLLKLLTDLSTSDLFLSGTSEEILICFNHHLNIESEIKYKLGKLEEDYRVAQQELTDKGEALLKLLSTELELHIKKLQTTYNSLSSFVVNEHHLGPNVKKLIQQLQTQMEGKVEFQKQKIRMEFKSKLASYSEFLTQQQQESLARGKVALADSKQFVDDIKNRIKAITAKNKPDPEVAARIKQQLTAVSKMLELIKTAMDKVVELNFDDLGL